MELDEHGFLISWRERQKRAHLEDRVGIADSLRALMDRFDAARYCRRADCRRALRCDAPQADCAFQHLDLLQVHVFPLLLQQALDRGEIERDDIAPALLHGLRRCTTPTDGPGPSAGVA